MRLPERSRARPANQKASHDKDRRSDHRVPCLPRPVPSHDASRYYGRRGSCCPCPARSTRLRLECRSGARANRLDLAAPLPAPFAARFVRTVRVLLQRSEEHTSELQSLMRISYAVFCLKKKKNQQLIQHVNIKHNKQM